MSSEVPATSAIAAADWQAFREHGKRMVDEIADYYEGLAKGNFAVKSAVTPGYLKPRLPDACPERPEDFDSILKDVQRSIMPGVTHWQSPQFYGYFPANSSPAALMGDMLSGAINCIAFSWISSPAATELETIVLDCLAKLMDLPSTFLSSGTGGGVIQGTSSEATLVALLAARARIFHRLGSNTVADAGAGAAAVPARPSPGSADERALHSKLVYYASDQAHSSVQKAGMIAGLHIGAQFRQIPTRAEDGFTLDPHALESAIQKDREAGLIPFYVVATMGTTSTGAFDPLEAVAEVCTRQGLWLHVDAAWAGAALICPELRETCKAAGLKGASSFAFNPHKWLRTNFDCCAMFVSERLWLFKALSVTPVYLQSAEYASGLVSDYRDWQVPLGRRFRSLKLWFVMRMYGAAALRDHIRGHIGMAGHLAAWIGQDARFELSAPVSLALVCFHLKDGDGATEALLQAVMSTGKIYLVNTRVAGRFVIRFAIGSSLTTLAHVQEAWQLIQAAADGLQGKAQM